MEHANASEKPENIFYYDGNLDDLRNFWVNEDHFVPLMTVYSLTFLLGVTGNALVIYSLRYNKSRSITTPFLTSLAVADLLFLTILVPYETSRNFISHWNFGLVFCKVAGLVEMITGVSSVLNLTAISIERHLMLVHTFKSRSPWTNVFIRKILIAVWLLSLCLSSPVLHIIQTDNSTFYQNQTSVNVVLCGEKDGDFERLSFAIYQFSVLCVLPAIIMAVCYGRVIHALWDSTTHLRSISTALSNAELTTTSSNYSYTVNTPRLLETPSQMTVGRSEKILRSRRQVIKMLCAIVVVFLMTWGPKHAMKIMLRLKLNFMFETPAFTAKMVLDCLPYAQSCINPIIYGFMSRGFRKSLGSAWSNCCNRPTERVALDKQLVVAKFSRPRQHTMSDNNGVEAVPGPGRSPSDIRCHRSMIVRTV